MIMWNFKKKKKKGEIEFVEKRKTDSILNSNAVKVRQQKRESERHHLVTVGEEQLAPPPYGLSTAADLWPPGWNPTDIKFKQTNKQTNPDPCGTCTDSLASVSLWSAFAYLCGSLLYMWARRRRSPLTDLSRREKKFGQFVKSVKSVSVVSHGLLSGRPLWSQLFDQSSQAEIRDFKVSKW